jgi:hypothetical protein
VAVTPLVAAVAALWLVRVAVEVRRWYWQREAERWTDELRTEVARLPLSHVRPYRKPYDQDR